MRGQSPDTAQSGNAFWLTRAELGANDAGMRPAVFADLGWVGDRAKLSEVGRPMSGVGAGVSFLDGLFRFDVARGHLSTEAVPAGSVSGVEVLNASELLKFVSAPLTRDSNTHISFLIMTRAQTMSCCMCMCLMCQPATEALGVRI